MLFYLRLNSTQNCMHFRIAQCLISRSCGLRALKVVVKTFFEVGVEFVVDDYIESVREHICILDHIGEQVANKIDRAGGIYVYKCWHKVEVNDASEFGQTTKAVDDDVRDDKCIRFGLY